VTGELIGELGEVRYSYDRRGRTVDKRVRFFLYAYRSGDVADHDREIEDARWMDIERASRELTYAGEREMVRRAISQSTADR
jgi:hypothetical protein